MWLFTKIDGKALNWKPPNELTICPNCHHETYKINYSTMERYCTRCGFNAPRRSTENVDQD